MNTNNLPMNTLDEIPSPRQDAKRIVALVKQSGKVTGYKLSDNSVVSKEDGINLAKQGMIAGVGIAHRKSTEYLKTLPDSSDNNNLSNLPTASQ